METHFANTGKIIDYKGAKFKIINSGRSNEGVPYVNLDPENKELANRMCAEIRQNGNLTVRIGGIQLLVLGEDEYALLQRESDCKGLPRCRHAGLT